MTAVARPEGKLGAFTDAFRSWRSILGMVPQEARSQVFANAAAEVATFVARGLDRIVAVDELSDMAIGAGLDDADEVQARIAEAFANIEAPGVVPDDWSDLDRKRTGNGHDSGAPFGQTSAQFVEKFAPPDYLLDGVLQRRFLYAFTGKTGSGKTCVGLLLACSVPLDRNVGNLEVSKGTVFYLAGENPDDVRMRWIALGQQMDFNVNTIDVRFYPGRFKISEAYPRFVADAQAAGGVALVIVDTSAAYFEGDDPNNNTQQKNHAALLRTLTELPGGPCVLANCHPVKNAAADNLIPYGGGAFLNEVDGNLTCATDGQTIEVNWQGKFRGPDFQPINFELIRGITHERLKDSKGRLIPTVIVRHMSEVRQREIAGIARSHEDQLLAEINRGGHPSQADLARQLGWFLRTGDPHKTMVARTLGRLADSKLIVRDRDGFQLTERGRKAVNGAE